MKFKNTIIAIVTLCALVLSGNAYLAKAKDLQLLAMRVDQKINHDRAINLMDKIERYENRFICSDRDGCKVQMDEAQFELV